MTVYSYTAVGTQSYPPFFGLLPCDDGSGVLYMRSPPTLSASNIAGEQYPVCGSQASMPVDRKQLEEFHAALGRYLGFLSTQP